MKKTELLYLENSSITQSEAEVFSIETTKDGIALVLDRTPFYPQGGGQPSDIGTVISPNGTFVVEKVIKEEGTVKHLGRFLSGEFKEGENVTVAVDPLVRTLHARLHSAGHVIDAALHAMNIDWIAGKGYHFPQGPYVEYIGSLEEADKGTFQRALEAKCNNLIMNGGETTIESVSADEAKKKGIVVPGHLSPDQPVRVITLGGVAIACGGTHVGNLSEIISMNIRKVKQEKELVRVAYDVKR